MLSEQEENSCFKEPQIKVVQNKWTNKKMLVCCQVVIVLHWEK